MIDLNGRRIFDRLRAVLVHYIPPAGSLILSWLQELFSLSVVVVDLERELHAGVILLVRPGDFLAKQNLTWRHRSEIETHAEVRRAGASLHVEDTDRVGGVVFKNVADLTVYCFGGENSVEVCRHLRIIELKVILSSVVLSEQFVQSRIGSVNYDFAGTVVDRSCQRFVDAAQIDDQLSVNIQPEIVVANELKDNIVTPGVISVRRHHEVSFDLHAEVMIVRLIESVQRLVFARIVVRQRMCKDIRQILGIRTVCDTGFERVVRHKLPVLSGFSAAADRAEFMIYYKVAVIQKMRKVLRTVKLIVSAAIVDALDEEMINLRRTSKELGKALLCFGRRRITARAAHQFS